MISEYLDEERALIGSSTSSNQTSTEELEAMEALEDLEVPDLDTEQGLINDQRSHPIWFDNIDLHSRSDADELFGLFGLGGAGAVPEPDRYILIGSGKANNSAK